MAGYNVDNILMNIFDKDDTKGKLSDKIPMITKEIEVLKNDMKSFLSTIEYDIPGIIEEGRELCVETKSLVDDMESCRLEIEEKTMAEMVKSLANRDQLAKELELVNFGINIIYDVVQCSKYIKECEDGKEAQSYSRCVEAVYDFIRFLDVPTEGFTELDIYPVYRNTADLLWDDLLKEVYAELAHLISWNVKTSAKKTIITITLDLPDTYEVVDVLVALDTCHKLAGKVSEFSQFLLKSVLIPMIKNECTVHGENDNVMKVTISHKEDYQPPYKTVFANLQMLFEFINEKLKLEFKTKRTLMQMVGLEIGHEFSKVLIRECLINTIPNTVTELLNYTEITIDVDNLQKFLYDISFFHDDISILSYLRKMDALFAKKSSQHFLERAREIMFKDLSVTMAIGVESIDDEAASSDAKAENAEALYILEKTIPKSLFYFPRCMISKTTQELLDLVYMMMEQASQCTGLVSKRLYNTTRLVFELYDAVVPYHHENYLQTIPQYVALFHNNCMYLAHHMQTFGDKWLNLKDGHQVDYPISFVDLVQKLRELGHKHLAIHMQQQRKQILDNIRSSDLNNIVVKDVLSENAEAAVRQCLRQLQLLKNVWIGVFPNNVFTRLMATLVNMFVDELIHRVCTVEDISMEIATQLTEMYTIVVQKAPLLFHEKTDIEQHVASWIKLQELIFVLGGSLKDIEAHWNDGTGPLALHFRTEELRSLIKALFQNTQMRANLLSKIK